MTSHLGKNIAGYEPGEIPVQGCVTVKIVGAGAGLPLQAFIDGQYVDSKIMSQRPGMYLKYLPYLYDEVSGKLLTGGCYLFDSYEEAKAFLRWAGEDFEVGEPKVKFPQQPLFESFVGQTWKVVGAHSFLPLDQHGAARLLEWKCRDGASHVEAKLHGLYPRLRSVAAESQRGVASVWLLYDPNSNTVGLETGFRKVGAANRDGAGQTLDVARTFAGLGNMLSRELDLEPIFDRSSVLLTLWLPKSRAAGGAELTIPYYPLVPDITHEHS